jgi:hypothetical protein
MSPRPRLAEPEIDGSRLAPDSSSLSIQTSSPFGVCRLARRYNERFWPANASCGGGSSVGPDLRIDHFPVVHNLGQLGKIVSLAQLVSADGELAFDAAAGPPKALKR